MFYKDFLKITDKLNTEFVEDFDYWLGTLPRNHQKNITTSSVVIKFKIDYPSATLILSYAEEENILEKYYIAKCPDCDSVLKIFNQDELTEILKEKPYCYDCDEYKIVKKEDIYKAYRVIKKPDASEDEIQNAIHAILMKKMSKINEKDR